MTRRSTGGTRLLIAGLVLAMASAVVGCGTPDPQPDLAATVRITDGAFVVTNNDAVDWLDTRLQINAGVVSAGYEFRVPRVGAGVSITIPPREFADGDGMRFDPSTMKPQSIRILGRLGHQEAPLAMWAGAMQ